MQVRMAESVAATRVVDPVLSSVARGFRHAMFAWMYLFPIATVTARGGRIITFGAEDFVKRDLVRAPASNRQRLQVGYSGEKFALDQRALDGLVAIERLEDAAAVPGIALGRRAVRVVMNNVALQIEIEAAELATKAASYDASHVSALAGADQWDHDDSEPAAAVENAKEQVAEGVGVDPNVLVIGVQVYRGLKNNKDVIDRIKHTMGLPEDGSNVVTRGRLASYFDVDNVVVAGARSGEKGAFSPIWGKNAVLAYSNISNLEQAAADAGDPSFGYCYRLSGYPTARQPWYDESCDSWVYPVTTQDTPVIAGAEAGFLFQNVVR